MWQAVAVRVRHRVAVSIAAALALAGCGSGQPKSAAPSTQSVTAAFKGSPAPLAKLHAQANELLSGGPSAFKARLAALKGYPVVVNKWASWCGPCQSEFPAYQKASVAYGRRVAFVGIDNKDSNGAASGFLKRFPVSYPSYTDPSGGIADSVEASIGVPLTVYLSRQGKVVFFHAGPYLSASALERDIRRYALG